MFKVYHDANLKQESQFFSPVHHNNKLISTDQYNICTAACYKNNLIFAGSVDPSSKQASISMLDLNTRASCKFNGKHNHNIHGLLVIDDSLVSASYDGVMKIWDMQTLHAIKTITAHNACISSLIKLDKTFLTSSYDHTIKEWDYSGNLIHTYTGHTDTIFSLTRMDAERFVSLSGNSDNRMLIWNINSKGKVAEISLKDSQVAHKVVRVSDDKVATAGGEFCLWDLASQKIITSIKEPFYTYGIGTVAKIAEDNIAVGSDNGLLILVDIKQSKVYKAIIKPHKGLIQVIIPTKNQQLITCDNNGSIIISDLEKYRRILAELSDYSKENDNYIKLNAPVQLTM